MRDGWLDTAPIHSDITRLDGKPWRGRVDLICGGFPCQDISSAGTMRGIAGPRSRLWYEMGRIIREVRPRWAIVENVAGLTSRGLGDILGGLASVGYGAEWDGLPASSFGAPHQRDRVFVVAYPNCEGRLQQEGAVCCERRRSNNGSSESAADPERRRLQGRIFGCARSPAIKPPPLRRTSLGTGVGETWQAEPGEGWLDDGLPSGLVEATSRGLGNAVVPQVVEWIGRRIVEASRK